MKNLQNIHTQIIQWLDELVPFIKHSLWQSLKIEEKGSIEKILSRIWIKKCSNFL